MHLGHKKQIDRIREENPDCGIVCLMSGNFVQRGQPAIVDKALRAQAAIHAGADLVLELPITAALSSAEGFAEKGVSILSGFCDYLSFGMETADISLLNKTVDALLSNAFREQLLKMLDTGLSFPAARQKALENMGIDPSLLENPNNILAVEYCKAIRKMNSPMIYAYKTRGQLPRHKSGCRKSFRNCFAYLNGGKRCMAGLHPRLYKRYFVRCKNSHNFLC